MTPDMMVVTDLAGRKISGERNASSELKMHLAVYELRPDVQAVVHAHPPLATGFAVAGIAARQGGARRGDLHARQHSDRRLRDAVDRGAAGGGRQVHQGARRAAARQPRRADGRQRPVQRLLQDGDHRALRADQPGRADARRRARALARGSAPAAGAARRCTASPRRRRSAPTPPATAGGGETCQVVQAPVTDGARLVPDPVPATPARSGAAAAPERVRPGKRKFG